MKSQDSIPARGRYIHHRSHTEFTPEQSIPPRYICCRFPRSLSGTLPSQTHLPHAQALTHIRHKHADDKTQWRIRAEKVSAYHAWSRHTAECCTSPMRTLARTLHAWSLLECRRGERGGDMGEKKACKTTDLALITCIYHARYLNTPSRVLNFFTIFFGVLFCLFREKKKRMMKDHKDLNLEAIDLSAVWYSTAQCNDPDCCLWDCVCTKWVNRFKAKKSKINVSEIKKEGSRVLCNSRMHLDLLRECGGLVRVSVWVYIDFCCVRWCMLSLRFLCLLLFHSLIRQHLFIGRGGVHWPQIKPDCAEKLLVVDSQSRAVLFSFTKFIYF